MYDNYFHLCNYMSAMPASGKKRIYFVFSRSHRSIYSRNYQLFKYSLPYLKAQIQGGGAISRQIFEKIPQVVLNLLIISLGQQPSSASFLRILDPPLLYRDPQLQVGENYSHLFNLRANIGES